MRISVSCRSGRKGKEPCSVHLGSADLPVAAIVERHEEPERQCFEVRVFDGRRFVLCHHADHDDWELAAVYGRR
jgi:hypothetical protein